MKRWLLILLVIPFFSGCASEEQDDLAQAQACLDNVSQTNPSTATECLKYVEKYDSQQANILKCGIYMTSGGLVENKIVKAYKALKDTTITNKETAYMTILALDQGGYTKGFATAKTADLYCKASGVKGLMYLSGVIRAGTNMAKMMSDMSITFDINNPNSLSTAAAQLVADCTSESGGGIDAACQANIGDLGETVMSLSTVYCTGSNADQSVCSQINSAVDAAGSNPEDVGKALFCYLEKPSKKFDPATKDCI